MYKPPCAASPSVGSALWQIRVPKFALNFDGGEKKSPKLVQNTDKLPNSQVNATQFRWQRSSRQQYQQCHEQHLDTDLDRKVTRVTLRKSKDRQLLWNQHPQRPVLFSQSSRPGVVSFLPSHPCMQKRWQGKWHGGPSTGTPLAEGSGLFGWGWGFLSYLWAFSYLDSRSISQPRHPKLAPQRVLWIRPTLFSAWLKHDWRILRSPPSQFPRMEKNTLCTTIGRRLYN